MSGPFQPDPQPRRRAAGSFAERTARLRNLAATESPLFDPQRELSEIFGTQVRVKIISAAPEVATPELKPSRLRSRIAGFVRATFAKLKGKL